MNKLAGILCASLTGAAVLLGVMASLAGETTDGPRINQGRTRPEPNYAVSEPATVAMLGGGLVALGIYAKKKNAKKN